LKNTTLSEQSEDPIEKYHTVKTVPKSLWKISHCENSPKIQLKNTTLSEQSEDPIEKYHTVRTVPKLIEKYQTVRTVPKSNWKIVERDKIYIIPNTQIQLHDCSLSRLGKHFSKLVLWAQTWTDTKHFTVISST
jgi:hypothetical protein